MTTKSTKTKVLLICTLLVWGAIIVMLINRLFPNDDISGLKTQDITTSFQPKKATVKDTFSIDILDKDPFLGTLTTKQKTKSSKKISKPSVPSKQIHIPVTYHGFINSGSTQLFILKINNQEKLIKKGQIIDSIKLIKGTKDVVWVSYKNIKKQITRLK